MLETRLESLDVIGRLRAESARIFGTPSVALTPLGSTDREASTVLKLGVSGAEGIDAVFVKRFKPREPGPAGEAHMRARLARDYEVTSRLYDSMARFQCYGVAKPLACFPEHLAIVTARAEGATLSELIERQAAWWPSQPARDALERTCGAVGGWLRAFHSLEPRGGRFSLDEMRAYLDVRLKRLLATETPVIDQEQRARVLRYFDRTAERVDGGDLGEVLTHGDLAPSNILVNGDTVTVIDFAMVSPGGLFMDVARLYTQLEFLLAKPKFRPAVVRQLQRGLLAGFDPAVRPERPLFRLFVLQHLLCQMSSLARNPAPLPARLYNRHQLRLRCRWLETFAA